MVGIISTTSSAIGVTSLPKITPDQHTASGESSSKPIEMDLEMQEFNRPVVVRGTDLPAGMFLFWFFCWLQFVY